MLLEAGSDLTVRDEKGWTPLHLCSQEGHLDIVKRLVLLQAQVNIQADNRRAPIHLACMKGQLPVVEYLLKHGAQIGMY